MPSLKISIRLQMATAAWDGRKGYYAALEAWDVRQDLEPLREFLKGQTGKTWEKQTARAEKRKCGERRER